MSANESSPPPPRHPLEAQDVLRLEALAHSLGLPVVEGHAAQHAAIWGWIGPMKVAVGVRFVGGRAVGHAHFVEAPGALLGPASVEPWSAQGQGRQLSADEAFDEVLSARGDPAVVGAWLDEATRKQLRGIFAHDPAPSSLRLSGARATLRGPDTATLEVAAVTEQIKALLSVVQSAQLQTRSLLDRAVHNALHDSNADVRTLNAALIGELMPGASESARAHAAGQLLLSSDIALDHRLDLLRIVRGLPTDQALPLMTDLLDQGPLELARRAVTWAEEKCEPETVRPLVRLLHRFDESNLTRGVVSALSAIKDPKAQPALLNLLTREDEALRLAVIEGLGGFGNRDAAAHIMPFTKGLFVDRELKRVAREAVDQIQARGAGQD